MSFPTSCTVVELSGRLKATLPSSLDDDDGLLAQVLVKGGESLEAGGEIIHLVAGTTHETGYKGLSGHFSPQELQVEETSKCCEQRLR